MKEKIIFNWSGGKDSAFALYKMLQASEYDILCLLTSINEKYQRISMHGVRVELLEIQAKSIGLPLVKMQIPEMPTMEIYENIMSATLTDLKSAGATAAAFGDIFLDDLRTYREKKLSEINLKALFPLWKTPTDRLVREFIDEGFKTIITCVNEQFLDKSFVGRILDHELLKELPDNVDPCGENGEFHTFVFDGPLFPKPIPIKKGEIVYRKYESQNVNSNTSDEEEPGDNSERNNPFDNGFWYCDLL